MRGVSNPSRPPHPPVLDCDPPPPAPQPPLHSGEHVHTRTRPTSATRRRTRPGRELKLGNIYICGGCRTPPVPPHPPVQACGPPPPRPHVASLTYALWRSLIFRKFKLPQPSHPALLSLHCAQRGSRGRLSKHCRARGGRTWTQLGGRVGERERSRV